MVRLLHINVSFAVPKSIELRIAWTIRLGGVLNNLYSNGISRQINERKNIGEDSSALIFIRGMIERKSLPGKIMMPEGTHVKISIVAV